jgi:hypothetical protein
MNQDNKSIGPFKIIEIDGDTVELLDLGMVRGSLARVTPMFCNVWAYFEGFESFREGDTVEGVLDQSDGRTFPTLHATGATPKRSLSI